MTPVCTDRLAARWVEQHCVDADEKKYRNLVDMMWRWSNGMVFKAVADWLYRMKAA